MDLCSLLHKDPVEVNPKAGQLLLAEPLMRDDMFGRSVIMILEQDAQGGHLGLCLNKGPLCTLGDLIPNLPVCNDIPLFRGGPVDMQRMFMLHRLGDRLPGSLPIAPGLYVGGDENELIKYLVGHPESEGEIRFFLGYSGWEAGQLTSEIMRNSWALNVAPDTNDLLRGRNDEYWRREVERLGPDYRSWLIVPEHPYMN